MSILVTGGGGYIGSHAVRRLLRDGHDVVVVDDFRHGHRELLDQSISVAPARATLIDTHIADRDALLPALRRHGVDAVMHFAAYIEVGESVADPAKYYRNNFADALALLDTVRAAGIERFVFSSTAAVYGTPQRSPIDEDHPCTPLNPYGHAKRMFEQALADATAAYGIGHTILRYFNVAGASPDGDLGEWHEPETHLIPRVLAAALDAGETLTIFGDDYDTRDGTCVRDYVHVEDLVEAHVLALAALRPGHASVYNLGSEAGFTVREVIAACAAATGREIAHTVAPRRAGDAATLVASSARIRAALRWQRRFGDLPTIIAHALAWQRRLSARRAG